MLKQERPTVLDRKALRARFETDITIETASPPIGGSLDEAFHLLSASAPVIRTFGPPNETGSLREGDAEMPLELNDKLSKAVSRLLAAGQLAEIIFPDGRKSTTFVMPEALLDEEVQKLNDPTLTQALLGTTVRVARSRHGRAR